MPKLLDVNLLFALLHPRHQHTTVALSWLETQSESESLLLCRVVQMGALRLLTRPNIMGVDLLTPDAFWEGWQQMMHDPRFAYANEPPHLEAAWRETTSKLLKGTSADTDSYLAGFARAGRFTLATFDKGFRRFADLSVEIVTP
ncbi:hypothetical protein EON81_20995 [bacterium]|nr:MAG: hypothetical protein EON81_20995 [bacterium]